MRSLRRRQTCGLALSEVFALIARFQTADHRQNLLHADCSRKPAKKPNTQTRPILRSRGAVFFEQPTPAVGVALFGFGETFEYLGASEVLLHLGKPAVQSNPLLFLDVVYPVAADVCRAGVHNTSLTRRFSSASDLESSRLRGSGARSMS